MNTRRHHLAAVALLVTALPGLSGCLPAVVAAGAGGGYAVHDRRSLGAQIDDQTLAFRIEGNINEDTEIKEHGHINVTSYNGRILITGEAPTARARARAAETAQADPNVRGVFNELQVAAPSSLLARSNDLLLEGKAKASLFSIELADFDPTRIKITVEQGIVYLMGIVTGQEADAATDVIRRVSGVEKVVKIFEYIR